MSDSVAVRIDNLWKRFGFRRALVGIDFEVTTGHCVAVFGPNGAGKSTLMKILATRSRPTSGKVQVFGRDVGDESVSVRRDIGVVFHENCLRSDLTLDENLAFYAGLYGLDQHRPSADRLLDALDLTERRSDPIRTFSQGMLKRATLVRSLQHDPRLWLLDEPFSGLDPEGRAALSQLIREERDGGRTVMFITHDIECGLELADDAVVLRDGEVAARGVGPVRRDLAGAVGSGGKG